MSRTGRGTLLTLGLAGAVLGGGVSAHVPLQPPGTITIDAELNVGGSPLAAKGTGECNYAADASIYQAPGKMWSVRRREAGRDVSLTLWRLARGGDQFTLDVGAGGKRHRVNTLQVGPAADRRGSGTVDFAQRGKGGQFTIDAVADTGAKITGTLSCSAFTSPEDNGD